MATPSQLHTTTKSIEIVMALQELDGATLTELSNHFGVSKSTIHRHLTTLAEHDFVSVTDNVYHIGFRFLELGEYARTREEAYHLAESPVQNIAQETGERAQFVVREHGEGVYLYIETGERAVQTGFGIGQRIDLHSTAAGKVILAHLPENEIDAVIDEHGLPPLTEHTITERDELKEELAGIPERGCAFNRQENIDGLCAVAGPVTDSDGSLIGVLSVSGPSNRMKGEWFESEMPDIILGSANELELRIAYA